MFKSLVLCILLALGLSACGDDVIKYVPMTSARYAPETYDPATKCPMGMNRVTTYSASWCEQDPLTRSTPTNAPSYRRYGAGFFGTPYQQTEFTEYRYNPVTKKQELYTVNPQYPRR